MKKFLIMMLVCILSLACFTGCEVVEDTFPSFDFKKSNEYVDIDHATMTMYFAVKDQNGEGWTSGRLGLYVSNSDQLLVFDHSGEEIEDYREIECYTLLEEFKSKKAYTAIRLPFDHLIYKYSQEIVIPSEYLQEEQGVLNFYLCDISGSPEGGYFMITLRYIKNVTYQTKDGQVKFNFDDCMIENPRHY